ncbi:energy transducer TonB [Aureimonas populi]|uniref:Energy transducer TonB n=1 Tax=Aureimonas populi TaxID=1701758 RepID=A0ABW5CPZ0_9HYPH|nr:energy transducer TonB [Aureimonas populi]
MNPRPDDRSVGLAALRWTTAVGLVAAMYSAGAMALMNVTPEAPPPAGVEQAPILIDLAPPAAAPAIASVDAPEGEELVEDAPDEAAPEPQPEPEPVPDEPPPPEPEPVPEPVEPPPLPEPEPEIVEPEPQIEEPLPEPEPEPAPEEIPEPPAEAEAVINVPVPTIRPTPPPRRQAQREEPRRQETRREQPRRQEATPPRQQQQRRQAPAPSAASQGQQSRQASQGASSSSVSPARWQQQVQARLNRFKRPPRGGGRGTVQVAFTISGSGAASGVRLARSSGNANLDQAALQLVQRASPFPAPPGGRSISLTVPIRYD